MENKTAGLAEKVESTTEMKKWMVDYVGNLLQPEDDGVTVEMIVETMAKEFPEFLMAVAEENWIRGYSQAIADLGDYSPPAGTLDE